MNRRRIYDFEYMQRRRKARRASASARFSLILEEILKTIWRPLSWSAFFIGIMMLSLPSLFGQAGWIIISSIFWIGFGYFLIEDLKKFKLPSESSVLRRVQKDNNLDYRPLEVLSDTPAGIFTTTKRKIWSTSIQKAEQDAKRIRLSLPQFCVSFLDHHGLRLMAFITLFAGVVIAGSQSYDRAMQGLLPFGGLGSNTTLNYTIWIDPPAYTGLGDLVFDKDSADDQKVYPVIPEGSIVKATVDGLWGPAWVRLYVDDEQIMSHKFVQLEDDNYMAESIVPSYDLKGGNTASNDGIAEPMKQNGQLKLRNLVRNFVSLNYTYRPDESPTITWTDENAAPITDSDDDQNIAIELENTEENKEIASEPDPFFDNPQKDRQTDIKNFGMNFPITMEDDYGIKSIEVHIALAQSVTDKPIFSGEAVYTKPMSTGANSSYSTSSYFDLSDHPFAGLPVDITVKAIDDAGQIAQTDTRLFTLKERQFSQLLAQRLVYLRKKLIWEGVNAAKTVAFDMRFQLNYPEDMRDNPAIWLTLKNVKSRLENAKTNEDIEPIIETLWTVALDLEDMGLSKAARELERITSKITRALSSNKKTDEEKLELFNEYREKMSTYLDKLREFNENRDQSKADLSDELMKDLLDSGPLQEMLDQMEDLAANGDYDSLEDMIAELQALLESFALGGGMPPEIAAMQKGLDVMQGLIDNQKHLLGDTEELAPLIPESVKIPKKGFGEIIDPPTDIFDEWFKGDIPPAPGMDNKLFKFSVPAPQNNQQQSDNTPQLPRAPFDLEEKEETPAPTPNKARPWSNLPQPPMDTPPSEDAPRQNEESKQTQNDASEPEMYDDTLPDTWEQANIQEVLRFILGEVMGEVYDHTDKMPETMPLAELEMRKSTRTLDEDRPDESVPVQEEVIRLLEQAQKELQKQLQEAMQQRAGKSGSRFAPQQLDPLGRPTNPAEDNNQFAEDSEVEVPESFERRRIDEILEYLRKNSGDPERSQIEREYFRRLLKQF